VTVNLNIKLTLDGAPVARALAPLLDALKEQIVSQISDAIARLNTSLDAAVTRVTTDVAALKAQIADLQAKVDAGGATQADLDALAAAQAKLEALDPTSPATLPTPGA
jgi:phage-related minor tail protein